MSDKEIVLEPFPFCGEQPRSDIVYGQVYMDTVKFQIATCETEGCAMDNKPVFVEKWNVREGR